MADRRNAEHSGKPSPRPSYRGRVINVQPQDEDDVPVMRSAQSASRVGEAQTEAETILMDARYRAKVIIEEAEAEAKDRADLLEKELTEATEAKILAQFMMGRQTIEQEFDAIAPRLSNLVHQCVRRMIGSLSDRDLVRGLVTSGLSALRDQSNVIIQVHENDLGEMKEAVADLEPHLKSSIKAVEVDHLLAEGECRLKTQDVTLDVSVEAQIAALTRELLPPTSDSNIHEPLSSNG